MLFSDLHALVRDPVAGRRTPAAASLRMPEMAQPARLHLVLRRCRTPDGRIEPRQTRTN